LQPLALQQINDALLHVGSRVAAIHAALQKSNAQGKALRELAKSPLMLSIIIFAYQDVPVQALPKLKTAKAWQDHIFKVYVEEMLTRPRANTHYINAQTISWLNWLAKEMQDHREATFYFEQLDGTWLSGKKQKWISRTITIGIVALFCGLVSLSYTGLINMLIFGLIFGLVFGSIFEISKDWTVLTISALISGFSGRLFFNIPRETNGLYGGLDLGIFGGIIVGTFGSIVGGNLHRQFGMVQIRVDSSGAIGATATREFPIRLARTVNIFPGAK